MQHTRSRMHCTDGGAPLLEFAQLGIAYSATWEDSQSMEYALHAALNDTAVTLSMRAGFASYFHHCHAHQQLPI